MKTNVICTRCYNAKSFEVNAELFEKPKLIHCECGLNAIVQFNIEVIHEWFYEAKTDNGEIITLTGDEKL